MKRCWACLLALLLCFCVSCSKNDNQQEREGNNVDYSASFNDEKTSTHGDEAESFSKSTGIDEQIILDKSEFCITATSLEYVSYAAVINISIENKSENELSFTAACNAYSENTVNNIKVEEGYFSCYVDAGETENEEICFKFEELIPLGINKIEDISIGFLVKNNNYEEVYRGVAQVKTDASKEKTEEKSNIGIGSDFKAAMDAYETFMNKYVDFMKKYQSNPADLSLLADYAAYMSDYAKFCDDFAKWEDEDLNAAELAYYVDVQARVTKKLLEVAG